MNLRGFFTRLISELISKFLEVNQNALKYSGSPFRLFSLPTLSILGKLSLGFPDGCRVQPNVGRGVSPPTKASDARMWLARRPHGADSDYFQPRSRELGGRLLRAVLPWY